MSRATFYTAAQTKHRRARMKWLSKKFPELSFRAKRGISPGSGSYNGEIPRFARNDKVGGPHALKAQVYEELSLLLVGVFDGLLHFRGLLIFLGEALDAAGRIHKLLLAREKRVAVRADF